MKKMACGAQRRWQSGTRITTNSWKPLLDAVEKHGNHMLVECAIIALRKMKPFPATELADVVKSSKDATLRMVAMRALIPQASLELQPAIRAAMLDPDRFTAFAAAEAMGNIRKTNAGVMPLINTLSNPDPAVAARAAVSLGVIAARNEKETASVRERAIEALKLDFERFGEGCIRSDADWGYRPVGNALRAFGADGEAALRQLRDQRVDMKLADLAWRVLDLHQQPNTFSEVTPKENDEAYAHRPHLENPGKPATGQRFLAFGPQFSRRSCNRKRQERRCRKTFQDHRPRRPRSEVPATPST